VYFSVIPILIRFLISPAIFRNEKIVIFDDNINTFHMNQILRIFMIIFIALISACARFGGNNPNVTDSELLEHINFLSSDSLKGRLTASAGDSLAAEYIRHELTGNGLVPATGDGFQRFKVLRRLYPGQNNYLAFKGTEYNSAKDFIPAGISENGELKAEAIFSGYGFRIENDSITWNDYSKINVKGKWVMMLRSDPELDRPDSPYKFHRSDREKTLRAKDMGAGGVILVSGPAYDPDDILDLPGREDYSAGIPVIRIKRFVADRIITGSGYTIAVLERKMTETRRPVDFSTNVILSARTELHKEQGTTRNVVMLLPGEDEKLKDEYIIIGAHFDHIGMGGPGSASRSVDTIAMHPGADDNASGVSMMLELAEKFALTKGDNLRSILFIAFSGEEMGLLGSKYFADNPAVDLTMINAMINLDMVGRLQESGVLQVTGVGTAEGLKEIVMAATDTSGLKLTFSDEGYGPSDHSSFYGKNIPVLFYSTGVHADYHTPADIPGRINAGGMVKISQYIYKAASALANSPVRLKFREAGPRTGSSGVMKRRGVTLGIMPDFAGNVKNGLRADFVTPGRPADLGGMKKGDIITSIEGITINNIEDYMFRMNQLKKGQTIKVEVLRNNEKKMLVIKLE
jgi:hypothetical protein